MFATKRLRLAALAALSSLVIVASAEAAEFKGAGTNVYVPANSDVNQISEEMSLLRTQSRTIILSEDSEVPFHLAPQDCSGTYILDKDQEITGGNGYCDSVDSDGDVWWMWWKLDGEKGSWGVLGGTGKYDGMTGGGTTEILSQSPDGRFALQWEGSWKMK